MIFLFLIIAAQILALSRLVFLPYPELFVYPYLTNHGLLPYRDILDQHFPGLMFFPINFDNLGMRTPEVARVVQILVIVIIQVLIFFIGRKIFKSDLKALIANLLFLVWQPFFEGWVLWIDSLLPIFLLPAFYFSYKAWENGKRKDLFLGGLFLGIGLVFKQVVAPLALIVLILLYFKRKDVKEIMWLLLGILPFPLLMIIYIISKGIFSDFWYWTIVFNLTTFAKYGRRGPTFFEFFRVAAVYGFSLLGLMSKKFRSEMLWLVVFALGALFSANARFDFVHFQPSLPFICLMSVVALDFAWRKLKFMSLFYIAVASIFLFTFFRGHIGTKIYFFDKEDALVTQKIEDLTKPGEKIFLYGTPLHYYQITQTLPAGDVFVFQFPWFMMEAQDRVVSGLEKDLPALVVADRSLTIDGRKLTDFSPKINEFILQNYEIYDKIGSVEFLRLKKQYAYLNRH